MPDTELENLLRPLAPQVVGALVRRYGDFDLAEDATQEALLAAALQWPTDGIPDNPRGWLITVGSRRMTDVLRSEHARQRRENELAQRVHPESLQAPAADDPQSESDDTLVLLFMCCHPSLSPASQIALTLRAIGGLTTAEVARAFLVSEDTMARRITRAKQQVKDGGVPFQMPAAADRSERLSAVLQVLYLIFNEGYASTSGAQLHRVELSTEAIRLTRLLRSMLPDDQEAGGLLALMLLTDARRPARTGPDGSLIPMAEQDRRLWNADYIAEGAALVNAARVGGQAGPYQLQAAIAAVHDVAPDAESTEWSQIVDLYEQLLQIADNPVVALNHAVAVAMLEGPQAGLSLLANLETDQRIAEDHRLHAVRAHLLEMTGDHRAAYNSYLAAAQRARSLPQQRYLNTQATRLLER